MEELAKGIKKTVFIHNHNIKDVSDIVFAVGTEICENNIKNLVKMYLKRFDDDNIDDSEVDISAEIKKIRIIFRDGTCLLFVAKNEVSGLKFRKLFDFIAADIDLWNSV